ncbi:MULTISPECIES: DNA cytosine methyltransferase [Pimelobacter]|uniref:DNA cytosine methyltransferase n=1 Tax=Pimelobacter TaxID=2044 RepID=UPI00207BB60D|nr:MULTISPECIES: DNA cytosine methyltransferase [Pimelobacter]UUW92987.1 DNA cytosine methyltransferase [Pimelobacter simplex]UUW99020.1 DNA cytosine methyltransferase [Pimelobacter simplex]
MLMPKPTNNLVAPSSGGVTVTDMFCGGGGSSTGMGQIPGVVVVMAANHWDLAIKVHNANHPEADHAAVDLHEENPRFFPQTDVLWASPECTKWSQASGGRYDKVPLDGEMDLLDLLDPDLVEEEPEDPELDAIRRSRLLMFDVLRFAEHHRYRAMVIENVVDIATQAKYATAWRLWCKSLANLGYDFRVVSLNSMHAQVHGAPAPQSRDRIYVVCWRRGDKAPNLDKVLRPRAYCPNCDQVIESQQAWKNGKTVGRYRQQYVYVHGGANGCGTIVEPGWLPAAAAIDWSIPGTPIGARKKPLAVKTRARIAAGIARYWAPVHLEAAGNTYDAADPKHRAYGDPNGYYRSWTVDEPLRALTATQTRALAVPVEGRDGKDARPVDLPGRTQTTRSETALLTPSGGTWNNEARPATDPHRTMTTREHMALVQPPLHVSLMGGHEHAIANSARPVDRELRTITAEGNNDALLTPYYGTATTSQPVTDPVGTLTTVDRYALVTRHNGTKDRPGAEMTTPIWEALRTLTTTAQQSIITPGELEAAQAQVDDCLFRMLEPHEVAAGMAFPSDYMWEGTRRQRVKLAGNAVTPPAARDIIAAVIEPLAYAA